jgi:hypothetical protein
LVKKPQGKRPLGRPRHKWEDNIQEMEWEDEEWIHLAQDRGLWWNLLNTVINLCIP